MMLVCFSSPKKGQFEETKTQEQTSSGTREHSQWSGLKAMEVFTGGLVWMSEKAGEGQEVKL